jgi:hypothetical protein
LNGIEFIRLDNGGVAVLDVILLNLPCVLDRLLGQEIGAVCLLKLGVAFIFFVGKD